MCQAEGTVSTRDQRREGTDGPPRGSLPDLSRSFHDALLWFPCALSSFSSSFSHCLGPRWWPASLEPSTEASLCLVSRVPLAPPDWFP